MNVVDSSAWLEYFANGRNAESFAPIIERTAELIVPSLTLFEVFKRILEQRDEDLALQAVAVMEQGRVVGLDSNLAVSAARISAEFRLPMADSVVLATARAHAAILFTQDEDFAGVPGAEYRKRKPARRSS